MKYRKFEIEVAAKFNELITFIAPESLSQLIVKQSDNPDHIVISAIESFSDVATLIGYSKKRMDKTYRIMLLNEQVIEYNVDYEPKIYYLGEVLIQPSEGGFRKNYSCYGLS